MESAWVCEWMKVAKRVSSSVWSHASVCVFVCERARVIDMQADWTKEVETERTSLAGKVTTARQPRDNPPLTVRCSTTTASVRKGWQLAVEGLAPPPTFSFSPAPCARHFARASHLARHTLARPTTNTSHHQHVTPPATYTPTSSRSTELLLLEGGGLRRRGRTRLPPLARHWVQEKPWSAHALLFKIFLNTSNLKYKM